MEHLSGLPPSYALAAVAAGVVVLPLLVFIAYSLFATKRPAGAPPVWGGGWPLISHFPKFSASPVQTIKEGYIANGSAFTMRFLGNDMTFLIGPDAHGPFFAAGDDALSQNEPYRFMTPIFGRGIVFDAPTKVKAQQLKFMSDALHKRALESYVGMIAAETEAFLDEQWAGKSGEVDLLEAMAELTILTASRCLLGREVRETLFKEVSRLLRDIDEGINPLAIFFPNLPLPSFRVRDRARAEFAAIFSGIIAKRRAAQAGGGEVPVDLLQAFMDARYPESIASTHPHLAGKGLTDDQITGMLLGTLFAGQHTSSITTTWTALNVSATPGILPRVMAEQAAVLGAANYAATGKDTIRGLDFASVGRMEFLHLCMKESLRLFPPLIMLMRKVQKPLVVCGGKYTVPAGHLVFASPAVAMNLEPKDAHDPKDAPFKEPSRFNPDRYDPAGANEGASKYSYIAFGAGLHACLGENFGYLQVKTIVSILLRRYELTLVDKMPGPNYRAMVVGPTQPCRVRYTRRETPFPVAGVAAGNPVLGK